MIEHNGLIRADAQKRLCHRVLRGPQFQSKRQARRLILGSLRWNVVACDTSSWRRAEYGADP